MSGGIESAGAGAVAKRGRPVLELGAGGVPPRPGTLGPWGGRVRVVPIEGLGLGRKSVLVHGAGGHEGGALFAVVADWYGPGLPELPPAGRDVEATDECTLGDLELAQAIAQAAADLLRAGEVPWLRHVRRAFEEAGTGWARRYEELKRTGPLEPKPL